jgi:hypothetical protein
VPIASPAPPCYNGARHLFAGGKIMKLMKLAPAFLAVILIFVSCETTQLRILHNKEIRAKTHKYSDVLDAARSKICLDGAIYHIFNSAEPKVFLSLYLKPGNDNRETIIAVRDDFIAFFGNNSWEVRGDGYPNVITIEFLAEENGEDKILYRVYNGYEWSDQWRDDSPDGGFQSWVWNPGTGTPFMRKNIHELDILLNKYSDILDIEQSDGFHSGTDFIRINIHFTVDPYHETLAGDMRDELVIFFNNNHMKLTEEYGPFNRIGINLSYTGGDGITKRLDSLTFRYNEQDEQWQPEV